MERTDQYYDELKTKMETLKTKNNQRSRGDSLVLAAMEIEVQTHTLINVEIKNKKGKVTKSHTCFGFHGAHNPQQPQPTTSDSSAPDVIPSSPERAHQEVVDTAQPGPSSADNDVDMCRVCLKEGEFSYWLGCSHRHKITDESNCDYWVH